MKSKKDGKALNVKKSVKKVVFYCFMILLSAIVLLPIVFIIFTALKSPFDFYGRSMFTLPNKIMWSNFSEAFNSGSLSIYMKNGLIISLIKVPLGIIIEGLAAFALTRLYLKNTKKIFMFFLVGMMVPMLITLVPINVALNRLSLTNTYVGLIFVYIGFGIPFGILVLRGYFRTIPFEIDESAKLDGCSNLRLLVNIIAPMSKAAIASLFILDFLGTWNEYLMASILITRDSMRTVPSGLMRFVGEHGVNYGLLTAGILITIVPVLIVYILFQRYFVEGMSGAIKG